MDLGRLRQFIAVIETGGITAAAREVGLTQPALSRRIKALEDELGVSLLARGAHSIKPTAAGEVLARDGARLLAAADQLEARVRAADSATYLRVGYSPSLAGRLLAPALERFRQVHPDARITLHDQSAAEMREALAADRLDLILAVAEPGELARDSWEPLCELGWRLAVPPAHAFATRESVDPAELAGQPLLIYQRDQYPDYWRKVGGWIAEHTLAVRLAGEYDGIDSLGAAVEAGLGLALVAARSRPGVTGTVPLVALDHAPEPIQVAIGRCPSRAGDPMLEVFVAELKREAGLS